MASVLPDIFNTTIPEQEFLDDFLDSFEGVAPEAVVVVVSKFLGRKIEAMPVGISYRPLDFTSTLWVGNSQFKGNYGDFRMIPTQAYERGPQANLGVFHSEFNLTQEQKKAIAIAVDRTH